MGELREGPRKYSKQAIIKPFLIWPRLFFILLSFIFIFILISISILISFFCPLKSRRWWLTQIWGGVVGLRTKRSLGRDGEGGSRSIQRIARIAKRRRLPDWDSIIINV
ncbi:hypothetical protein EJ05DRAFT_476137 [Pseudovirgaria hyperparasitica]|uniref:Transmembrane protein n=1 Tax=Pseudovirgaria hyperparasitica TaxID=470096 RepID=A0A6A6W9P7_9PEZI|nr:uncharacterized protein EJ05DRAFT_476137 [Pseudovirgaria hyperparasitica]KAF2757821.1 hypothetical protein EJ05DRAFT_476137 [Pseudovirgaria hyperparasitica]